MPPDNDTGAFVPTTNVWDPSEIYSTDVNSEDFKELLVRLYQNINNISLAVNIREAGYYVPQEFVTGGLLFPDPSLSSQTQQTPVFRPLLRELVILGTLPNDSTISIPHGITPNSNIKFVKHTGFANDTTGSTSLPLPYVSRFSSEVISFYVDATNINVTTGSDRTNYDTNWIVLEYIKQ